VDECLAALGGIAGGGWVVGEVSLWGTVVECARGFRASSAYPLRIHVPAEAAKRNGELVAGLSEYGVPVTELRVGCQDAMDELRQRDSR
jgi:hypothetical protein